MATGTAGSVHLLGPKINLAHVWEASRQELKRVLGTGDGTQKVIVWDEVVIGQVGLFAEVQFLRQHGVSKMARLPSPGLTEAYPDAAEYIFFIRPLISYVDHIIESIRTSGKKSGKKFKVVFVPVKTIHCVNRFSEYGFQHDARIPFQFSIDEIHLEMLPLDHDVITLDIGNAYLDIFADSDPSHNFHVAKAICMLQTLYGVIPKIYGKGKNAKTVCDLLERMRKEMFSNMSSAKELTPQIDAVVLLDRNVDLMTPLSTQLTYEGLIDEIYGINHSSAKFPRQMFSEEVAPPPKTGPPPTGPITLVLNSEEEMYGSLRDLNFRAVGHQLSFRAKEVTRAYEERHDAKTVSQLKQFVQKLPHMQQSKRSLSKHTTIAELIKGVVDKQNFLEMIYTEQQLREEDSPDKANEYIEKCIGTSEPIVKVLRLMCMQSVANGGLKPRLLEYYKKAILNGYGAEHLVTLQRLENAGLLHVQDNKTFPTLRKALRLVHEGVDEMNPKDIAYIFSGYAPLSVRLLELLDKPNGWATFEEATRMLPGPSFQKSVFCSRGLEKRKRPTVDKHQTVLVFFIGGCTFAEIAALRFLSQREDAITDYMIGTTNIFNGVGLINSVLVDTPRFRPVQLWDNQMDEPAAVGPVGRPAGPVGRPAGPVGRPAGPVGRPAGPVGRPAGPVGRPPGQPGRGGGGQQARVPPVGQQGRPGGVDRRGVNPF